jgi:hypothetical protein
MGDCGDWFEMRVGGNGRTVYLRVLHFGNANEHASQCRSASAVLILCLAEVALARDGGRQHLDPPKKCARMN